MAEYNDVKAIDHGESVTTPDWIPHVHAILAIGYFASDEPGVYESCKLSFAKLVAIVRYEYYIVTGQKEDIITTKSLEEQFAEHQEYLHERAALNVFYEDLKRDECGAERNSILGGLRKRYNRVPGSFREPLGLLSERGPLERVPVVSDSGEVAMTGNPVPAAKNK